MNQPEASSRWQLWIDRGGTFTDIVAKRPDGGLETLELLSNNAEHNRDAAIASIRRLLRLGDTAPDHAGPRLVREDGYHRSDERTARTQG